MGANPCPGVGVARAVRAAWGAAARIVAADDCKFSDPAFSEFRKIDELGSTVSSAGGSKQQQWDIAVGLLKELVEMQEHYGGHEAQAFYYPVIFTLYTSFLCYSCIHSLLLYLPFL